MYLATTCQQHLTIHVTGHEETDHRIHVVWIKLHITRHILIETYPDVYFMYFPGLELSLSSTQSTDTEYASLIALLHTFDLNN